jgi:ABC-2 type transport system ATP-binding protein
MEPLLELNQVTKTFSGFTLNNLSLRLEPGFILGCIGPNGSGKTTLIRLIMHLIQPDTGSIHLFGTSMDAQERSVKDRIGFVYDEPCLYEDVLPFVMKNMVKQFYSRWDDQEFFRYFELFELPSDKALKHFSQGMKMKYMTALALSHHAQLIILDEPTSGLDPVSRHEILELLQAYISDGDASVLFSTHITSDLERIADYICLLDHGNHRFTLPKDEVLDRYKLVIGSLEDLAAILQNSTAFLCGYTKNSFGFEGVTDAPEQIKNDFPHIALEHCSLDNLMLYLTKRSLNI